jgi:hypothetical protein
MPPRLVDLFDDADVLQWSGNLLGGGAQAVRPIASSNDAIVLVAWSAPSHGAFRNLLRCRLMEPSSGVLRCLRTATRTCRSSGWAPS